MITFGNIPVGAQSFCYRDIHSAAEMLDALKATGLYAVEVCGCHVDEKNEESVNSLISLCAEKGVKLTSYGVNGFSSKDPDGAKRKFEFAKKAGFSLLAADVDGTDETAKMIDAFYREYGVKLMLHNHGRNHANGSPDKIAELFSRYSDSLGLLLDTGWMLDSGFDPADIAERFGDRVYGVHLKDFTFEGERACEAILGDGTLNLPKLVSVMKTLPNLKAVTIEYEGDNPVVNVHKCARNFAGELSF